MGNVRPTSPAHKERSKYWTLFMESQSEECLSWKLISVEEVFAELGCQRIKNPCLKQLSFYGSFPDVAELIFM
jgi:hypothetical protein